MTTEFVWGKQAFDSSVSSRCWCFTPYDGTWDEVIGYGQDPANDTELCEIVRMEHELVPLPDWVGPVVEGSIRMVGPCGHYRFPQSFVEAIDAIGNQRAERFHHTCYTVDQTRKRRAQDYALCLDAWLAGADPGDVVPELEANGSASLDWTKLCDDLWQVLGSRTELKDLLIERMLHALRWYIKFTMWDDDRGDRFGRDQFLGIFSPEGSFVRDNGNPQLPPGGIIEKRSPRVKRVNKRIRELTPHAKWFLTVIVDFSWLCAPKAFRFMEKTLWCIGHEEPRISLPSFPLDDPDDVPGFLQCEDTCPNIGQTSRWWADFLGALAAWWQQKPPPDARLAADINARLGESTPTKRWLVRLMIYRCQRLAEWDSMRKLTTPPKPQERA